ncbi:hypothetical protein BCR43DRAFT_498672 [Syncephalastrum racemosum]|uniref:Rho-GAP domain-containing protein n=1 Tax=Syncephalastrum racemosum TaxID=13706 RepID=A0A1X2H1A2_SYNRA|nr:hypothetical protein BCR43DRAFT_498672 [Syncephalastrum racemosum]
MHHHQSYQESFWPPTATSTSDFGYGLNVLHKKLKQSMEENQAITDYIKRRVQVEHAYANQLATLNAGSPKHKAFERDVGAGLKKCFEVVRSESSESVDTHRRRAENLESTALDPIERFASRYQRIIKQTKSAIDERVSAYESAVIAMEKAQGQYLQLCQGKNFDHPRDPFWLGDQLWTRQDIDKQLHRSAVHHGDDDGHDNNNNNNNNINNHHHHHHTNNTNDIGMTLSAQMVQASFPHLQDPCRSLVLHGFLQPTDTHDAYRVKPRRNEDTTTDPSSNGTGFFGRWTGSKQDSPTATFEDILAAEGVYRDAVKKLEKLRMQLEEALFVHYEEMESLELERIQTIKQGFISMAATLSNSIPLCKELYDRMMLYQETLKPDKDVQFIVEQYRTGRYCPKPVIYTNYFHGAALDQMFGVSLEEYTRFYKVSVPPLISEGLTAIEEAFAQMYIEEKEKTWTAPLQLDRTHEARDQINMPFSEASQLTAETLKDYDAQLLASLIRLYLMELPDCLSTFELYDPIKQLYTNQHLDQDARLAALTRLLITLPSANFYTLKKLFGHFHKLIQDCDDTQTAEDFSENLTTTFSTILLRPQTESNLTLHDRHPQRFVRDILRHYDDVFNESSIEAHKKHINQRRPVADKAPSLEAPSINSSISSMHVDTPTTQTTFDDDAPRASADSASSPARRRTLLSFMRRGSNQTSQQLERSKSMSTAAPRRVLPLPSSSTLFEDPDVAPPVAQRSATQDSASHLIKEENEDEIRAKPKEQLRSRASTFSMDGSLDSFFKDEEL